MTRGLFATMLERADTKEAIGLNRSRFRSTRPLLTGNRKHLDNKLWLAAEAVADSERRPATRRARKHLERAGSETGAPARHD